MNNITKIPKENILKIRLYHGKRMTEFPTKYINDVEVDEFIQDASCINLGKPYGKQIDSTQIDFNLCFPYNGHSVRRLENLKTYIGSIRIKIKLRDNKTLKAKGIFSELKASDLNLFTTLKEFAVYFLIKTNKYTWHIDRPCMKR